MAGLFLSHSSADKSLVRLFAHDLIAAGVHVWLDESELGVGDSIPLRVLEAIRHSAFFVVFLSANSSSSTWVLKELSFAMEEEETGTLTVLAVRLDATPPPNTLTDRVYVEIQVPRQYDRAFWDILTRVAPHLVAGLEPFASRLGLDEARKERLIVAARDAAFRDWVLDYLIETLPERRRHPERHRTYTALGTIGGVRARTVIEAGLNEADDFPRMGAERALAMLDSGDTRCGD